MAKKERKMTEAEAEIYMQELNQNVGALLNAIQKALPPKYIITLVARHPEIPEAQMIWTKDDNLEAVADAVLDNKAKTVDK